MPPNESSPTFPFRPHLPPFPHADPDLQRLQAEEQLRFDAILSVPPGSCPLRRLAHLLHKRDPKMDLSEKEEADVAQLLQQAVARNLSLPALCCFAKKISLKNKKYVRWLYQRDVSRNNCHVARWFLAGILEDEKLFNVAMELYKSAWKGGVNVAGLKYAELLLQDHNCSVDELRPVMVYRKLMAGGCLYAMSALADLYLTGEVGVYRDEARAMVLYERAVQGGCAVAMRSLGEVLIKGIGGVSRDEGRGVALLEWAIREGDEEALLVLASVYQRGYGNLQRDMKKVVDLYEQGVQSEWFKCAARLGELLYRGDDGVEVDWKRALELFLLTESDEKVFVQVRYYAAIILSTGCDGVEKDIQQAVDVGWDEGGLLDLVTSYRAGYADIRWDFSTVIELCEEGVRRGWLGCTQQLGDLFYWGADEGVEVDMKRALDLFNMLEDDEDYFYRVRHNIAKIVSGGYDEVEEDLPRAVSIYERILAEGGPDIEVMYDLARILQMGGRGVEQDTARAAALYETAISMFEDDDTSLCMFQLGVMLSEGWDDFETDVSRAAVLLEHAMESGVVDAKYHLAGLLAGIDGEPTDIKRGMQMYEEIIEDIEHIGAMNDLAIIFGKGLHGVERDMTRAIELCERGISVALENDEEKLRELGIVSAPEWGVNDLPNAVYSRSVYVSNGMHFTLMWNLAELMLSGMTPRNVIKAIRLCERAATCPNKEERWCYARLDYLLREAERMMCGNDERGGDAVSAVRICELVVGATTRNLGAKGHALRMLAGVLIEGREGVPCDNERALRLYKEAVKVGDREAAIALGDVMQSGIEECALDEAGAFDLYSKVLQGEYDVEISREAGVKLAQICERRRRRS